MAETGIVAQWLTDDEGNNKGFGFIERDSGQRLFCHKSKIVDGDALHPGSAVTFDATEDERKPNSLKAVNVSGGVCFGFAFSKKCSRSKCKLTHAIPPAAPRPGPSVDEAAAAVAASRADGLAPVLVDTVDACAAHCRRLSKSGIVAVDFEGVDLGRHGELLLAQLVEADGQVILIDIGKLGGAAFEDGGLRDLLESEAVLKLIYDARSDADALFHLFECRLTQACDCQVLYTLHMDIERQHKGEPALVKLPGLANALSNCAALSASGNGNALAQLKKAVRPLFIPEVMPCTAHVCHAVVVTTVEHEHADG
jgi:cold shock CspA family protein